METDFVLRLITVRQLAPPVLAGPRWPWAVRVRTLGGFRLDIGSKRYKPAHKAQDKPLELLKLLVTCQALGRESPEKNWIAERLWPEANIENARKSLDMTVGRLRRLLGADEIVSSSEGRLELSRQHVWTDIGMLLHGLSRIRQLRDEYVTGKPAPTHAASISVKALLEHYTGQYLANEDSPPWILAGRQAIVGAVRETLSTAESILGDAADDLLIPALEKALSSDQTSEDLARALMRAHLRRGVAVTPYESIGACARCFRCSLALRHRAKPTIFDHRRTLLTRRRFKDNQLTDEEISMAISNDEARKALFKAADALDRATAETKAQPAVGQVVSRLDPAMNELKVLGNTDVHNALLEAARALNNLPQESQASPFISPLKAALPAAIQFLDQNPGPPPVLR